jgi:hypothetical protein
MGFDKNRTKGMTGGGGSLSDPGYRVGWIWRQGLLRNAADAQKLANQNANAQNAARQRQQMEEAAKNNPMPSVRAANNAFQGTFLQQR